MARLFITISFILSLCVLLFTTSSLAETDREWAQYQAQCQYKYPTINPAIDLLCSRNLHLPGVVASIGQNFDRTNKVAIVPNPQCLKDGRMNQNTSKPSYILTVCDSTTNDAGDEKQMPCCSEQEALVTDDP
ncbi:hypothetical protein D6C86_10251 [Aureobasidium pullulans]|uniref:Uncharacterized protein n=1 Tax=Aureobasidium pullulans TaxID=5580 RepID=A0A4S9VK52_AURPU|nr:hypothetical protein D6C94_06509 [Aureobasidium pullulans]THZ37482.1 hypothetical protein D6C87_08457 [Aureobasidium pullulans]THZ52420.1 hypothetical protein D6C86_10251 [Aureobasidium pullulans]THZ96897.1 hypothetical protein D6C88_01424 [Aureobasidium pullulans]